MPFSILSIAIIYFTLEVGPVFCVLCSKSRSCPQVLGWDYSSQTAHLDDVNGKVSVFPVSWRICTQPHRNTRSYPSIRWHGLDPWQNAHWRTKNNLHLPQDSLKRNHWNQNSLEAVRTKDTHIIIEGKGVIIDVTCFRLIKTFSILKKCSGLMNLAGPHF